MTAFSSKSVIEFGIDQNSTRIASCCEGMPVDEGAREAALDWAK